MPKSKKPKIEPGTEPNIEIEIEPLTEPNIETKIEPENKTYTTKEKTERTKKG